jgi:hypothetical protein
MKKLKLLIVAGLVLSPLGVGLSGTTPCSSPFKQCLFVDAAGCSVDCTADECCVKKTGYCVFGFGVDAACDCVPCGARDGGAQGGWGGDPL